MTEKSSLPKDCTTITSFSMEMCVTSHMRLPDAGTSAVHGSAN